MKNEKISFNFIISLYWVINASTSIKEPEYYSSKRLCLICKTKAFSESQEGSVYLINDSDEKTSFLGDDNLDFQKSDSKVEPKNQNDSLQGEDRINIHDCFAILCPHLIHESCFLNYNSELPISKVIKDESFDLQECLFTLCKRLAIINSDGLKRVISDEKNAEIVNFLNSFSFETLKSFFTINKFTCHEFYNIFNNINEIYNKAQVAITESDAEQKEKLLFFSKIYFEVISQAIKDKNDFIQRNSQIQASKKQQNPPEPLSPVKYRLLSFFNPQSIQIPAIEFYRNSLRQIEFYGVSENFIHDLLKKYEIKEIAKLICIISTESDQIAMKIFHIISKELIFKNKPSELLILLDSLKDMKFDFFLLKITLDLVYSFFSNKKLLKDKVKQILFYICKNNIRYNTLLIILEFLSHDELLYYLNDKDFQDNLYKNCTEKTIRSSLITLFRRKGFLSFEVFYRLEKTDYIFHEVLTQIKDLNFEKDDKKFNFFLNKSFNDFQIISDFMKSQISEKSEKFFENFPNYKQEEKKLFTKSRIFKNEYFDESPIKYSN